MAVKRFTIELDDSPDTAAGTSLPPTLIGKEKALPSAQERTTTPEQQAEYQAHESTQQQDTTFRTETIGRTPADLVVAFIHRPEFMATTLTFFAFIICIGKLQKLNDFWLPLLIALIQNIIWFGISGGRRRVDQWNLTTSPPQIRT